jgi:type II secretory pathway pseudopilin PulG
LAGKPARPWSREQFGKKEPETMNMRQEFSGKPPMAFTLVECLISIAIIGMSIGGVIYGYTFACRQAEWTAYSLAAQSMAIQRMEQTRAATWDPRGSGKDDVISANFPVTNIIMDLPQTGTNIPYCTNITTITRITTNNIDMKLVKVEAIWFFRWSNKRTSMHTNTIMTYRAPDQ